jgi:ABC-type glycerol-3-phosphate transport system permease component
MVQALGQPSPGSAVRLLLAMGLPVIVALLAQRYLIRGLTLGALKG